MIHGSTLSRVLAVLALSAVLAATAMAQQPARPPSGTPIKIGLIAELTGALSFYGIETQRTATLLVKQMNASGGLLGRPVELIVRDSKTTVNDAVRQARDLLFTENVDFL